MTKDILHNRFVTFKPLGLFGNQMFQIATTVGYAKIHGINYKLPVWINSDGFDLSSVFKGPFGTISDLNNIKQYEYFDMHYTEIPKFSENLVLHGYFQNEKYFKIAEEELKEIFKPNYDIKFPNTCSIHVRRGDYLKHPLIHTNISMDYYRKAIEIMKSKGYEKFMVFSDDIDWCKHNFIGDEYIFSEGQKNYQDLIMMSGCQSHIIANSSFSWWGAWLGNNSQKSIIAPSNWFGPKGPSNYEIIPTNWITL
jgi:hypothetical protein